MSDDRRSTIAAAMEAVEEGLDVNTAVEKLETPEVIEKAEPVVDTTSDARPATADSEAPKTADVDEPTPTKTEEATAEIVEEKQVPVERPPQSWKAPQKAKWDKLDPDIRQEVLRRERETTKVLSESASARQLETQFHQVVQPFMGRLQSMNAHPLAAVQELLKADFLLATGPVNQKTQLMAKLISDYGVDIQALDAALSGKAAPDPVESKVEQLLQQRLAPFQQYMTQQEQLRAQQEAAEGQRMATTVESMAMDTTQYPYFEQVRDTMADVVEVLAKRGVSIDLKEAYNRAVAMDPTVSQELATQTAAEALKTQAAKLNGKAQRALKASSSVGGAPGGSTGRAPDASDRRAVIMAAFDTAGGR